MTVRLDSLSRAFSEGRTLFSRLGSVILYTGDNCALCDVALKVLHEVVTEFGLPLDIVTEVDIDTTADCDLSGIVALPTISICGKTIPGLPDVDDVRGALMNAILGGSLFR
ncbi:MAG: hypothetical protein KAJ96_08360 [Candidatus Thorarchaeota archaeon]|nr:hypothetical protein [Candidatus Thorarchaeota archaeon]